MASDSDTLLAASISDVHHPHNITASLLEVAEWEQAVPQAFWCEEMSGKEPANMPRLKSCQYIWPGGLRISSAVFVRVSASWFSSG
jgi:hypothetical protein